MTTLQTFFRVFFAILTACGAAVAMAQQADNVDAQVEQSTHVRRGDAAPEFACQATDGRQFDLSSSKGKVTVLYFFSTSVGASLTEMRHLENEVVRKVGSRDDFQIIGIGRGHTREELVKVGGENRLTFPLAADPQAEIYGRYFLKFVPRTVVVGRDGSIIHMASGYDEALGLERLKHVLNGELKRGKS